MFPAPFRAAQLSLCLKISLCRQNFSFSENTCLPVIIAPKNYVVTTYETIQNVCICLFIKLFYSHERSPTRINGTNLSVRPCLPFFVMLSSKCCCVRYHCVFYSFFVFKLVFTMPKVVKSAGREIILKAKDFVKQNRRIRGF